MYKYFLIFIIFLTSCSSDILPESQDIESREDIRVIEANDGFDILFDSWATREIRDYYESWNTVINGSYFWYTHMGMYYPAGLWIENGIEKSPMNMSDPNLSHIVFLSLGALMIAPNEVWVHSLDGCYHTIWCRAFQAGPLVLSGNILQSFPDSWHASGPHERTLIGKTESGKVYFIIFRKPRSLTEVADIIVQDDRFTTDPITLLNLDGWPSTAYYDGKNGFRENEKLPIIFRIKQ